MCHKFWQLSIIPTTCRVERSTTRIELLSVNSAAVDCRNVWTSQCSDSISWLLSSGADLSCKLWLIELNYIFQPRNSAPRYSYPFQEYALIFGPCVDWYIVKGPPKGDVLKRRWRYFSFNTMADWRMFIFSNPNIAPPRCCSYTFQYYYALFGPRVDWYNIFQWANSYLWLACTLE